MADGARREASGVPDRRDPLTELLTHPDFREGEVWERVRCAEGETVVREGEPGDSVFVVLTGQVRVLTRVSVDEGHAIRPGVAELGPGEVFGEMALFHPGPRSASVVAVTDAELARIPAGALERFLDARPELGYRLLKHVLATLVARLRRSNTRIAALFAWGLKAHGLDRHL